MIDRRRFLIQASLAGGALLGSNAFLQLKGKTAIPSRDAFGGDPSTPFAPTGFFRLEKADRWWLVTPDGNSFLSLGMNHVSPSFINQPYNADFWEKRFGGAKPGDAVYRKKLQNFVSENLRDFGFNTLGVHNSFQVLHPGIRFPWVKSIAFVNTHHYKVSTEEDYLDVFSPDFQKHCYTLAKKEALPLKDDPYLLGYAMTDCPILTELDAAARPSHVYGTKRSALPTWPRVLRNLSAAAPGKQAYVSFMRERYNENIQRFNQTYATKFRNWKSLAKARNWRPELEQTNGKELQDNGAFLELVVDKYYSTMVAAIKRQDSNHLIFGDKLNANTDSAETIAHITSKYTDLVFYQQYGRWQEQRNVLSRLSEASGKPAFNGDGAFHTPHENMPNPHGPHAIDQIHRADLAIEFAEKAFALKTFVGWSFCGWVETWKSMPRKELKQHGGIMDAFGEPYQPLQDALRSFSERMYQVASG